VKQKADIAPERIVETPEDDIASVAAQTDEGIHTDMAVDHGGVSPVRRRFLPHMSVVGWLVVGIILVNALIAGSTAFVRLHTPKAAPAQAVVTPSPAPQPSTKATEPVAAKLLHYKAEKLNSEFDYPEDWRVQDFADSVYLSSPQFTIKNAQGVSEPGSLRLTIAKSYLGIYAVYDESEAVDAAEQLKYTNPAPGQVQRTFASFFAYGTPVEGADDSFSVVVIGGSFMYLPGQRLSDKNYKAASPFVELHIESARSRQALIMVPLTRELWRNDPVLKQAKDIVASMRFN
jgi:hypothetical protein